MADLSVRIGKQKIPTPIFVGAGPNNRTVELCVKAFEKGAGMVEYGTLIGKGRDEKVTMIDQMQILPNAQAAFRGSYFGYASVGFYREWNRAALSTETKLEDIRKIKEQTKSKGALCMSIGVVGYKGDGRPGEEYGWGELAKMAEQAGADAVTLHLQTGQALAGKILMEDLDYLRNIIMEVKSACGLTVIAKLPIEGVDPARLCLMAEERGADAVAPTARYLGLNINIIQENEPEWEGFHGYGGPWALPITSAWTARMTRAGLRIPSIPGGGVMSWQDVVKLVLAGGTMAQVCSWPIIKGYDAMEHGLQSIRSWMEGKGYKTIDDFRGNAARNAKDGSQVWSRRGPKGPYEDKIQVNANKCIGCGACTYPCYFDAIHVEDDHKAHINKKNCVGCGHCYQVCPQRAIETTESVTTTASAERHMQATV